MRAHEPAALRPHRDVSGRVLSRQRKAALIAGQREKPAMASLRQEHHYGLSCGKNNKNSPNRTLYHVKLTDTAIRALEAYQNLKGSLPSEPSICFKGNQGYIKIPAPTPESPSALRVFSFYLSSDSKDQPQASFDCIHQYVSSDGHEQLEGQGIIQDKITVCATDDSYQMTRERMSQVEKDSWSHSAIEIKPGATHPSKNRPEVSVKQEKEDQRMIHGQIFMGKGQTD